jgi:hypothetical protein
MSNALNNNRLYKWITGVSFFIALILFGVIVWQVFFTSQKNPEVKSVPLITTTTTIKIDSSIKSTGKKIIIDTTIVSKPAETETTSSYEDRLSKKLSAAFNYFLLLFGVFVVLAVLPRLKAFNFGKNGVSAEFYDVAKALNEAQNNMAQMSQVPQGGKTATDEMKKIFLEEKTKLVSETGALDPQKGRWGGQSENNNRKLSAIINRITGSEWANITLRVVSTDPQKHPLKGLVTFHLHPTFINPSPVIIVLDGVAELKTKAWGAFTVGAVADGGATMLELDLQHYPGSFEPFNSR